MPLNVWPRLETTPVAKFFEVSRAAPVYYVTVFYGAAKNNLYVGIAKNRLSTSRFVL